jgi:hypothetical protein
MLCNKLKSWRLCSNWRSFLTWEDISVGIDDNTNFSISQTKRLKHFVCYVSGTCVQCPSRSRTIGKLNQLSLLLDSQFLVIAYRACMFVIAPDCLAIPVTEKVRNGNWIKSFRVDNRERWIVDSSICGSSTKCIIIRNPSRMNTFHLVILEHSSILRPNINLWNSPGCCRVGCFKSISGQLEHWREIG